MEPGEATTGAVSSGETYHYKTHRLFCGIKRRSAQWTSELTSVVREPGGGGLAEAEPLQLFSWGGELVMYLSPPAGGIEIGNLPTQFHRFIHRRGNRGEGSGGSLPSQLWGRGGGASQLFMRPGTVGAACPPQIRGCESQRKKACE